MRPREKLIDDGPLLSTQSHRDHLVEMKEQLLIPWSLLGTQFYNQDFYY